MKIGKLESNRLIYKIINEEIKLYIHSLQILINLIHFLKIILIFFYYILD